MKRNPFVTLAALALVVACADGNPTSPGAASGPEVLGPSFDIIANGLDATVEAVAEAMPLNVGATETTQLYLIEENGDGKNGCNLTGSTSLGISVSSSDPTVATVSPSSDAFTSCGDTKTLTVTAVKVGSTTITVSQTSNTSNGTFNLAPATFIVTVSAPAPANTAPSIAVVGVTAAASYNKGSVPAATCDVTDAEDGNTSFAATLSAITGPYSSDGIGSQTASCSYTDGGGLTASASKTYSIVDPSAPGISYVLNPTSPDGSNDWYTSNVTLTWTVSEPQSPNSLQKTGCVDQTINADQAATVYSCSATSAGGSAGPVSVTIKRDATAPTISGSASPAANGNGWNNSAVTVSFTCSDAPSGIASGVASCAGATTLSTEGAGQSVTGNATDNAGNTNSTAVSGINIDLTKPTVALVGGPANGSSYYFGDPALPAGPTCTASDDLSGLDAPCSVSGYGTAVGSHTVKASATDEAGNANEASATYTVLAWTPKGFYQPVGELNSILNNVIPDANTVWNTVKGGSTVPLKFEVFAGSTEKTSTADIKFFKQQKVVCPNVVDPDLYDEIDIVTTGGTSLRYDATAGQFIQNWATPKVTSETCYRATVETQDGSTISAFFKLRK